MNLGTLIQTRDTKQAELHERFVQYDPVPILCSAKGRASADVLSSERYQFSASVEEIIATFSEQTMLLDDIVQHDLSFKAARQSDPVTMEREKMIQDVVAGTTLYDELQSNITEGKNFYRDLGNRVEQLRQTVVDHCAARSLQRREMELNCSQQKTSQAQMVEDAALAQQLAQGMNIGQPSAYPGPNVAGDAAYAASLAEGVPQRYSTQPVPETQASDKQTTEEKKGWRFSNLFGGGGKDQKPDAAPTPNAGYPGAASAPAAAAPPPQYNTPPPPQYNAPPPAYQVPPQPYAGAPPQYSAAQALYGGQHPNPPTGQQGYGHQPNPSGQSYGQPPNVPPGQGYSQQPPYGQPPNYGHYQQPGGQYHQSYGHPQQPPYNQPYDQQQQQQPSGGHYNQYDQQGYYGQNTNYQ